MNPALTFSPSPFYVTGMHFVTTAQPCLVTIWHGQAIIAIGGRHGRSKVFRMIVIAMLLGLIPALIANLKKGRSFFLWWLYGTALFIVALPHSILISSNCPSMHGKPIREALKKCPYCSEMIGDDIPICQSCAKDLSTEEAKAGRECPFCHQTIPLSSERCPLCQKSLIKRTLDIWGSP